MVSRATVGFASGFLGCLLVLLAAAGSVAAQDDVVEVRIVDTEEGSFAFEPSTVTIEPGMTVRWVSESSESHTVTANDDSFHAALEEGDSFEHTFSDVGMFHYFCQPHASFMTGMVVVENGEEHEEASAPGLIALVGVSAAVAFACRSQ